MKPSEIKRQAAPTEAIAAKPLRVSEAADPPISQEEARMAGHSICPWHNGLVRQTGDRDGAVFYCPTGKMYWRYSKANRHAWRAIRYSARGIV